MSYNIVFDSKAKEKLEGYDKGIRKKILKRINKLKDYPEHFGKPLTGISLWVLRAGDYRIIFDLNKDENRVEILRIGHRKNIYKDL